MGLSLLIECWRVDALEEAEIVFVIASLVVCLKGSSVACQHAHDDVRDAAACGVRLGLAKQCFGDASSAVVLGYHKIRDVSDVFDHADHSTQRRVQPDA